MNHPWDPPTAKQAIQQILDAGEVRVSAHAKLRMGQRNMTHADINNVLRCGLVAVDTPDGKGWPYKVWTAKMVVVVVFHDEVDDCLVVKTVWRT